MPSILTTGDDFKQPASGVACPYCDEPNAIKNGIGRSGNQRWHCYQGCNKTFTLNPDGTVRTKEDAKAYDGPPKPVRSTMLRDLEHVFTKDAVHDKTPAQRELRGLLGTNRKDFVAMLQSERKAHAAATATYDRSLMEWNAAKLQASKASPATAEPVAEDKIQDEGTERCLKLVDDLVGEWLTAAKK